MDKLHLPDISLVYDPYRVVNSVNFVKDLFHWLPTEFDHIGCYFIDRPRVCTPASAAVETIGCELLYK